MKNPVLINCIRFEFIQTHVLKIDTTIVFQIDCLSSKSR